MLRVCKSMCTSLSVCTSDHLGFFSYCVFFTALGPCATAFAFYSHYISITKIRNTDDFSNAQNTVFFLIFYSFSTLRAFCLVKYFNHLLEDGVAFLKNQCCLSGFLSDCVNFKIHELFKSWMRGNVCN